MGLYDIVDEVIVNVETLFDSAEAFRLLGWLNELVGRIDQAIAWTLRARDLEPDNPDHLEKLANLYAMIGMPDTALRFSPDPGIGLLFRLRRYEPLIDIAEELMIDQPDDMNVRYLLAFAYTATGSHESAIHVVRSTGIMESVVQGFVRTVAEIEAYYTLINALNALGDEESVATARSLAERGEEIGFYGGEIGWVSLWRSCGLAVLGQQEKALAQFAEITKARRLPWQPLLLDSHCLRQLEGEPIYEDALAEFEARRAAIRDRLPGVLAEFGVSP
jgi:tetratricopeptide (TPR) repeat protein